MVSANCCIHDLHANLRIKLLKPQFSLAILHQRARLHRLSELVADGDVQAETYALVRRTAVHQMVEHGSVAYGWVCVRSAGREGGPPVGNGDAIRALRAAYAGALIEAVNVEGGQQGITRALQRDLIVPERKHRLLQFRTLLKSLLHQRLDGLLLLGDLFEAYAVSGNDGRRTQRRIVQIAGDRLLDDLLLIVQGALRTDEGLFVRSHARTRR